MSAPSPALDLVTLSAARFQEYGQSTFMLLVDTERLTVILEDCMENPDAAGPDATRTPFRVLFRANEADLGTFANMNEFTATIHGLAEGAIENVYVSRILRPVAKPPGCYFQVIFT